MTAAAPPGHPRDPRLDRPACLPAVLALGPAGPTPPVGLTDEEYFFEPVPGCWSVRPAGAPGPTALMGSGPDAGGLPARSGGAGPGDHDRLAAEPPGRRRLRRSQRRYFGGPPMDYLSYAYRRARRVRWPTSTPATNDGWPGSPPWVRPTWPRTAGNRGSSRSRWRPWSCTSTGRRSITSPRSPCSATCGRTGCDRHRPADVPGRPVGAGTCPEPAGIGWPACRPRPWP